MLLVTVHRDGDFAVLDCSCACGQRKQVPVRYQVCAIVLPEVAESWIRNHAVCAMHPNTEKRREL